MLCQRNQCRCHIRGVIKVPVTTGPQYRFMQFQLHSKHPNIAGPSRKVAEEFIKATPVANRKKWSKKKKS